MPDAFIFSFWDSFPKWDDRTGIFSLAHTMPGGCFTLPFHTHTENKKTD